MRRSLLSLTVAAIGALIVPFGPALQAASSHAPGSLANVRYIYRGLTVTPPGKGGRAGKVRDPLYQQYAIRTQHNQKASLGFRDGTVLHVNADTDALLSDPHTTQVRRGEVAEYLAPGADHKVQTAAGLATSIGTTYDVRTDGSTATFVVLHGALQVSNAGATVVVKSNHESVVQANRQPSAPTAVDARAVFSWTEGIPTPDLGEDVALDANGGSVLTFSSQRSGPTDAGHAFHIADGLLSRGWESATGKVANQSVTIGFLGGNFYRISDVIIDPAATYGEPTSEDLKDFSIRVSSTDTQAASFTEVFRGRCKRANALQHFTLPVPVRAKYIQLVALSNYGSTARVAVAEFEAVATASLFGQPLGVAADRKGFLYVADTYNNRIVKLSARGKVVARWGKKGSALGQFLLPQALTVDRKGSIYVADTYNNRVQELSPKGKALRQIGGPGVGQGQFSFPKGVAVDASGNVYVADTTASRIEKFGADGKFVAAWSDLGAAGSLSLPERLTLDGKGVLYVADTGNSRIVRLTTDGALIGTIGNKGASPGQFNGPTGVALDAAGNLYVADNLNYRVQKINSQGQATVWGKSGTGPGEFLFPEDVAVDGQGHVFVDDTGTSRIERFGKNGKLQAVWGKYASLPQVLGLPGGIAIDAHDNVYIADSTNDRIQLRDTQGHVRAVLGHYGFIAGQQSKGLGQFWWPHGIAIDRQGAIYVADTSNSRVQVLAARGPIDAFGKVGSSQGQFLAPFGVATDAQGNIYVADSGNHRVQKLSPAGQPLAQWGSAGTGSGQFILPFGIAVDSHGNIYVSDYLRGRVQKLGPDGTVIDVWGQATTSPLNRFFGPEGLTVDRQDNLYVADSGHGVVQKIAPDGRTVAVFQLPGPNTSPIGVAVDSHGYVYAVDALAGHVVKFAPTGEVVDIWS